MDTISRRIRALLNTHWGGEGPESAGAGDERLASLPSHLPWRAPTPLLRQSPLALGPHPLSGPAGESGQFLSREAGRGTGWVARREDAPSVRTGARLRTAPSSWWLNPS